MPMMLCKHCGRQFTVSPSKVAQGRGQYCCKACADAAKTKPRRAICGWCGGPMPAGGRPERRFCGHGCGTAHAADVLAQRARLNSDRQAEGTPWFADPWASGGISPDPYTDEPIRTPDPVLGF